MTTDFSREFNIAKEAIKANIAKGVGIKKMSELFQNENFSFSNRIACANYLIISNNIEYLRLVEAVLNKEIRNPDYDEKTRIGFLNGLMDSVNKSFLREKTQLWFLETTLEQYWILYQECTKVVPMNICAQYLLQHSELAQDKRDKINDQLEELINNKKISETQRANIADTLYRSGDVTRQIVASFVIRELGGLTDVVVEGKVYENSQNVHDDTISETIRHALEQLAQDSLPKIEKTIKDVEQGVPSSFMYTTQSAPQAMTHLRGELEKRGLWNKTVASSMDRISIDSAQFTIYKLRIRDILQRVWNRIHRCNIDELKEELIKRMCLELEEMNDQCSSGHVARLVNVLTGINDSDISLEISIGLFDEILTCTKARLNTKVRNMLNKNRQEVIMCGMMKDASKDEIDEWHSFIDENSKSVYTELFKEYEPRFYDEFTEQKFIEYFEKAIKLIKGEKVIPNSCSICHKEITNPVEIQCECEMIVCKNCIIDKWISKGKKTCPKCKTSIKGVKEIH